MRAVLIRGLAAASLALALYMVASSPSHLKWLALTTVCTIGLYCVWIMGFRWLAAVVALVGLNVGLYSGVLTNANMWQSVGARLELTTNTLAMWLAAPFQGHGIGSFNYQYPLFQEAHIGLFPWLGTLFDKDMSDFAGAAHNEFAQILADYGLIGFALAGGLVWSMLGPVRDNLDRAARFSLILAAIVCLVEFPLQNPHTGVLLAVVAGISCNGRRLVAVNIPRLSGAVIALPMVAFLSFVSVKSWAAHSEFSYTQAILSKDPLMGVAYNVQAYNTFSWPRHIRHQLAVSMAVAASHDPDSIKIDPIAADKMFRISEQAAGRATAVEVARIEYLIMSGRAAERVDEIEGRLAWLRANAGHQNVTWLIESKWAFLTQDRARTAEAITVAQSMPRPLPGFTAQVNEIAEAIK